MANILNDRSVSDCQHFRQLSLVFTDAPCSELLSQFANALNKNGHLPYTVKYEQLCNTPYVTLVHTDNHQLVAGGSIKHCDGILAEIGFMWVSKPYRRLGLAEYITQSRIAYAHKLGIKMLYAKIRGDNVKSMNNLYKAGFRSAGNFLSQKDAYSTITWLYLPLQALSYNQCCQLLQKKLVDLIPVIGQS